MTEEQKAKAEAFVKAYGELVQEHNMDFAHYPVYMPDGNGGFKTVIQSTPVFLKEEEFVAKEE